MPGSEQLRFNVSRGLKSVLGKELITDDEVAIFELVKNSFDADASGVDLFFEDDRIVISDDGTGMSRDDIKQKWLRVAYSTKRYSQRAAKDFRDAIAERRRYAGSKGIGRFSADRLGKVIRLQTRPLSEESGPVHSLTIDWSAFDRNQAGRFEEVLIDYVPQLEGFDLPPELPTLRQGTVISIEQTSKKWDRDALLHLKSNIAKLINPFGAEADGFRITIHAPAEITKDHDELTSAKNKSEEPPQHRLVNGDVRNFIFETLREKTTFIEVRISHDGRHIESSLTDRGELIYQIREPNVLYPLLAGSGFSSQIFFLNTSAKLTFAKRMGVPSVQFGSVFLFRNGFRVFPVGDEGHDWFGIDRRKQQRYAGYLGTRDLIGRIDVTGARDDFQEPSSRDTGLIATPAVQQLKECFSEHCLKRLERYVVPVTFADKEDRHVSDVSRLLTDPGKARVASAVARLVDGESVELLDYSRRLISILDERSSQFEDSIPNLRTIAKKINDPALLRELENAAARFKELRRSEEAARHQADEERKAKEDAQAEAEAAKEAYTEEHKRNLFLTSISALDTTTILNMHHQVTIYAVDIHQQIQNLLVAISDKATVSSSSIVNALERITLLNQKVMGISKFATKANFRLESEKIEADLGSYIFEYITEVAREFLPGPMVIDASNDKAGRVQRFKPIDVSVVVDNLIANARKARATRIDFAITHPTKDTIHILVADDGRGFHKRILDNLESIFERGVSTTDGSGLGLYHVRHVLGEMNGTIEAEPPGEAHGATFLIRIS